MSKKQSQIQKKALQPSSISMSKKQGRAAAYAMLTDQEKMIVAALPPAVQMYIGADQYERGWHDGQRTIQAIVHMERLIAQLARRCDYVDAMAATLEGQQLQDVLSGGLADAIQADNEAVLADWKAMNQARENVGLNPERDFQDARPDIAQGVSARLEALIALKDNKFTPIQSLKPLDQELDKLLNRARKQGRPGGTLDWLKKRWLEYEGEHMGVLPAGVKAALLDELGVWDQVSKSYIAKPGLTADQQQALKSLTSSKTNASNFRYNLIERKAPS